MQRIDCDAATKPRPVRGFVVFKWLVYTLLALNVALYAWQGTPTELLDTAAWLVLLLLFEWETGGWSLTRRQRMTIHALRLFASFAVAWAWASYALQREWLDFANASAWLAVVLALELEVRVPQRRLRFHRLRRGVTWLLYAALAAFVFAWLGQAQGEVAGAWLDAWDAMLWLGAFVAIELNVFNRARAASGPGAGLADEGGRRGRQ